MEVCGWLQVECLLYVHGLGGCLSGGGDLLSGYLGRTFGRKVLSESLFRSYSMGVLSSSQMVGANVGSQKLRGCRAPTRVEQK
jgi:hypothetical protein